MKLEKRIKKFYRLYKDFGNVIDLSNSYMLILAFIIVLPTLQEMHYALLGCFLLLMLTIKVLVERLEVQFPKMKLEEDFRKSIDDLESKIKMFERRIKNEIKKNIQSG